MGGAIEILGVFGNVRADWNPAYGLAVIPLVFLARFNGSAQSFSCCSSRCLTIGGESAARRLGVPNYFTLVLVVARNDILAMVEYYDQRPPRDRQGLEAWTRSSSRILDCTVSGAVTAGMPLLLAGLGEQMSEKAGRAQYRHRRHDAGRRLCRLRGGARRPNRCGLASSAGALAGVAWLY